MKNPLQPRLAPLLCTLLFLFAAQPGATQEETARTTPSSEVQAAASPSSLQSTQDWNRRLRERSGLIDPTPSLGSGEYTIGSDDVLDINVFEAQEMNREVRVSATGEISLPLLGAVRAAGLTPRELEILKLTTIHDEVDGEPKEAQA